MINILYISTSCSKEKYKEIFKIRKVKAIEPQQKFNNLLIEGIANGDNVKVTALSSLPVSYSTCDIKRFEYEKEVITNSLTYEYIPFRNGKYTRLLDCYRNTQKYVHKWLDENKGTKCYILVDALSVFMIMGCFKYAKKYSVPVVGIVTDLPELATEMKNKQLPFLKKKLLQIIELINTKTLSKYNAFITLTESLNEYINRNGRPYVVVEGSVDSNLNYVPQKANSKRTVVYAGGVYAKYGLENLVNAFTEINTNCELHIYGDGTYVEKINEISKEHKNIIYKGMVSLEDVVRVEQEATLLINPRPSNEEFSKYSFPSKTLEYMVSGTPLLTTRLPGIPEEYFNYTYTIEKETKGGLVDALVKVLGESDENLEKKGRDAFEYVKNNKTNIKQGKIIVDFLKKQYP
jgi:glycosyltransferase involved in cell wall biosynthesis